MNKTMKLIKLSEEHYIVVDDSEIKDGDFVYSSYGGIFERHIDNNCQTVFPISKITHSTQPIEYEVVDVTPTGDAIEGYVYDKIQELSLSEVKELLGVVDVEKRVTSFFPLDCKDLSMYKFGIDMYNQALEDNKEKKYTEEDMRKALSEAFMASQEGYQITSDEIIKSLQPKSEWEVEIVEGKLKLKL